MDAPPPEDMLDYIKRHKIINIHLANRYNYKVLLYKTQHRHINQSGKRTLKKYCKYMIPFQGINDNRPYVSLQQLR